MQANGQAPLQAVLPNEQAFVAALVAARLASELRYCVQGAQISAGERIALLRA